MDEKNFNGGAFRDPLDERDYPFDVLSADAPVEIDWKKGFDIRNYLGGDINFKNQQSSGSCVGQGWSYQIFVYQVIEMMKKYGMSLDDLRIYHPSEVLEISAKAIYSQIFINSIAGGAYIRDGAKLVCEWGAVDNVTVPSNRPDGSTDEAFMRDLSWKTKAIDDIAKIFQGKDYRVINAVSNMDLFARAILQNFGVVAGFEGLNNGTWMSERPMPPIDHSEWGHCLDFLAFGQDEIGNFIATPNSWGNILGKKWFKGAPNGYGWQKFYQNYFINGGRWVFNPWTFTDKLNDMQTNVKIIKDANSPAVGFFVPANNPDGLISMARNYGIEIAKKPDGGVDWDKNIQGTMTLK